MKVFSSWLLFVILHFCILAAISARNKKLGPPLNLEILTSTPRTTTTTTTTLAPIAAPTTTLIEVSKNITSEGSSSAGNNTTFYDHKHKILLLILSDLNVRKVRDPQQEGKLLSDSNNAANKILNETLILDEQKFKEFLTKFQSTPNKADTSKCEETSKCVNIVPHFVPPTFPWIIRKEPRKPIVYIEPLVCEDEGRDAGLMMASASKVSQTRRRRPMEPVRTSTGQLRSRVLKNARKRQRTDAPADYVLTPKFGASRNAPHSMYPPKYFHNMDYAHSEHESDTWADYNYEE